MGLSIIFGCFAIAINRRSSFSISLARFRLLNCSSVFLIKCFGRRLSLMLIFFNCSIDKGDSRYFTIVYSTLLFSSIPTESRLFPQRGLWYIIILLMLYVS